VVNFFKNQRGDQTALFEVVSLVKIYDHLAYLLGKPLGPYQLGGTFILGFAELCISV
jgi:hypothetical protein